VFRIIHDGGSFRILREEHVVGRKVRLEGIVDTAPAELFEAVDAIHHEAFGCAWVEIDLGQLQFMSAEGLRALVHWVRLIREQEHADRYKLLVLPGWDHDWQRSAVQNLARWGRGLLEIEG
jgi:hypothetical protein